MSKTVIDVRTRGEFSGGHVANSINIPLQEIPERINEIKAMQQPLILCCASGGRSAQATMYLKAHGIKCEDGGSWMSVNYELNQQ
ncbi:MAG: rhodanese-like domain-containing protein [Bacteroidia bacterium]|nr:rhodanese-like domain-containing protein [Bacteroidia bacterium]